MNENPPFDPLPGDYADLAMLARSLSVADAHLDTPPDDLWAGIETLVAAGQPAMAETASAMSDTPLAPVRAIVDRRALRLPFLLGAAAAVVVAISGLVGFVARDSGPGGRRLDEVALTNDGLSPEGVASRARATLVQLGEGEFALDVEVRDLPTLNEGFLELWIIDTNVKGMYSLGPLHGSGRYALPEHVAPTSFPIVDVSIEPDDGKPQHSGKSILRGQLSV